MPEVIARRHPGMIGERPVNNVWQEVYSFLQAKVLKLKAGNAVSIDEQQLAQDLSAHFDKRYNADMIIQLLRQGWEVKPGHFVFERRDFVPGEGNYKTRKEGSHE